MRIATRSVLAAILIASMGGCGGEILSGPCGGADFGTANPTYIGSYSGTYTNAGSSATAKDLTFDLSLTQTGAVSGTATEPSSGRTAAVTGNVIDWFNPCGPDTLNATIKFTFAGETARTVYGSHNLKIPFSAPLTAKYQVEDATGMQTDIGSGSLVLTKK